MMKTNTNTRINRVKQALRDVYSWPGGYPIQFFAYDGGICHKCVRQNFRAVVNDTKMNAGGWNLDTEVLWEGTHFCAQCGDQLETAYGGDDFIEE